MGKTKITRQGIERGEIDYPAFCGLVTTKEDDVKVLDERMRVTAPDFLERMQRRCRQGRRDEEKEAQGMVVVDVREKVEYELGAKVRNSINIPMSKIRGLKDGTSVEDLLDSETSEGKEGEDGRDIYFLCQRGNDSQIVAKRFLEAAESGTLRGRRSRWIGDVVGGFEALQRDIHDPFGEE